MNCYSKIPRWAPRGPNSVSLQYPSFILLKQQTKTYNYIIKERTQRIVKDFMGEAYTFLIKDYDGEIHLKRG